MLKKGCIKQGVKKLVEMGLMRTWSTGALGMRSVGTEGAEEYCAHDTRFKTQEMECQHEMAVAATCFLGAGMLAGQVERRHEQSLEQACF